MVEEAAVLWLFSGRLKGFSIGLKENAKTREPGLILPFTISSIFLIIYFDESCPSCKPTSFLVVKYFLHIISNRSGWNFRKIRK